jgi:hypothetical protein
MTTLACGPSFSPGSILAAMFTGYVLPVIAVIFALKFICQLINRI